MEEPGRLQSMGSRRVGHDWETSLSLFTFHFHALEKEMATHSSVLAFYMWALSCISILNQICFRSIFCLGFLTYFLSVFWWAEFFKCWQNLIYQSYLVICKKLFPYNHVTKLFSNASKNCLGLAFIFKFVTNLIFLNCSVR